MVPWMEHSRGRKGRAGAGVCSLGPLDGALKGKKGVGQGLVSEERCHDQVKRLKSSIGGECAAVALGGADRMCRVPLSTHIRNYPHLPHTFPIHHDVLQRRVAALAHGGADRMCRIAHHQHTPRRMKLGAAYPRARPSPGGSCELLRQDALGFGGQRYVAQALLVLLQSVRECGE